MQNYSSSRFEQWWVAVVGPKVAENATKCPGFDSRCPRIIIINKTGAAERRLNDILILSSNSYKKFKSWLDLGPENDSNFKGWSRARSSTQNQVDPPPPPTRAQNILLLTFHKKNIFYTSTSYNTSEREKPFSIFGIVFGKLLKAGPDLIAFRSSVCWIGSS